MSLLGLVKPANSVWQAQKIVLYGVQGIGKTTFGATFDNPILAPIEDGAHNVNIMSFPKITEYGQMVDIITALHEEHPYKTLVVDSLDWMEPLVWAYTCALHQKQNIEDFGYGKGYVMALDSWRNIMSGLDSLRENMGMNVVLIAHTHIKRFESPEMEPFDRYETKLQKAAAALWEEWADMVLFANYKMRIVREKGEATKRAQGQGERIIYTSERPAYKAKNRWGLPEEINVGKDNTWSAFHKALSDATGGKYVIPGGEK